MSGAFYRKELGDIDLVWGDSNFGLKHILDKHGSEFKDIAKELDEIIQNGEVVKRKGRDEAYNIEYKGFKVGINKGFNKQGENKWVVTAFNDNIEKTAKTAPANDSTKGASLPLNSNTIIPQQTLESTMQKFNYDEKKAKDLLEWHKDSSPLTKDENGVPKVFYHGSETDKPFEVFLSEKDQTKWGFWFSSNADDADLYARTRGNQAGKHGYEVFLKAKNIFDFNDEKNLEVLKKIFSKEDYEFMLDTLQKWGNEINVFNMLKDTNFDRYRSKTEVFKNELKKLGYDRIKELGDTIVVFDSNQIKHIDNKGVDGKFFNESSPNIYQSNAHLGSGLIGGSVAEIESDENGNLTFSPEKFALGLLGGAMSSKSIERLAKNPKARAVMERIYLKKDIMPKMQQGKKVDTQEVIKILENSPQKGCDMVVIGKENFTPEVVEWIVKNNKKVAIDMFPQEKVQKLGFKHPQDVRRTIDAEAVNHILKRHGKDSNMAKNGQPAVELKDIMQWTDLADNADIQFITKSEIGQKVLVSGKQINGHYVIIESIRTGVNELGPKTMYFEKGVLKDNASFWQSYGESGISPLP